MNEAIRKHLHIVFGFEHYNPLGIVRSLGENGIQPIGIIVKSENPLTSKSKYFKTVHLVKDIKEGYKILVNRYGKEALKPFVYASDDQITNFMDAKYDDIKNMFFFYNAGSPGRICEYQRKDKILELAGKHGLNCLKTVTAANGEIPGNLEYPVMTKAITSTIDNWKSDVFICHNDRELLEAYKHIRSERVLLQKYIVKKNELCLDGCSVNKGKDVFISIASRYNYTLPDSYSPYMTIYHYENNDILTKCQRMLEEIGFEGIFSIEFLVDQNDELYFLEVNLRNSTWSYASTKLGMNLPIIWATGMLNNYIDVNKERKEIPDGFTAMVEPDDLRFRVKGKKVSLANWLKDCKNAGCVFYCNKKDMTPVLYMLYGILKRKLKH